MRRGPWRRRIAGSVAGAAIVAALAAVPAVADPVPGATYSGTGDGGQSITFTVSSDGTIVDAFTVNGYGANCNYTAAGDPVGWTGAPIAGESFAYRDGATFDLDGTFTGAQTAAGTFRYDLVGTPNPCDGGLVHWTASTASTPSSGGTGGTGGGGGGGTGAGGTGAGGTSPGSGHGPRRITTRVTLRTPSRTVLRGRLITANAGCRPRRTVILWRATTRIASGETAKNGTFTFGHPARWRGRHVRVSVTARKLSASAVCQAGSSVYIHA